MFYKKYIIEVKIDKPASMEKLQIYDFETVLSLFSVSYKEIIQVEVEQDLVFLLVREKNDHLTVY